MAAERHRDPLRSCAVTLAAVRSASALLLLQHSQIRVQEHGPHSQCCLHQFELARDSPAGEGSLQFQCTANQGTRTEGLGLGGRGNRTTGWDQTRGTMILRSTQKWLQGGKRAWVQLPKGQPFCCLICACRGHGEQGLSQAAPCIPKSCTSALPAPNLAMHPKLFCSSRPYFSHVNLLRLLPLCTAP